MNKNIVEVNILYRQNYVLRFEKPGLNHPKLARCCV